MSDTPPPTDGPADSPPEGAGGQTASTPFFSQPATWIILVIAIVAIIIVIILLVTDDDDGDTETSDTSTTTSEPEESTTSTEPESTTTTEPESTTSTEPESTTSTEPPSTSSSEPPATEPTPIEQSEVRAELASYPNSPPGSGVPTEDGPIEAHWYKWDDYHVVVYAGWDATSGEPQCPGNSIFTDPDFEYISNSPTLEGSCDPQEAFPNLVGVDEDDDMGARVCDTLVLYHTIIPLMDETGAPLEGVLFGTIERFVDPDYRGATSEAPTNYEALTDLDPYADAYSVPEGWLPDGATEVVC